MTMLTDQLRFAIASPPLVDLKALVLLGGSVRPNSLTEAINRSVLDLPVDEHNSVLGLWLDHAQALVQAGGYERLLVRLLLDHQAPAPTVLQTPGRIAIQVERDPFEFRGTGGLLRDLAQEYDDGDWLLVVNAGQVLFESLPALAAALAAAQGDVSLISHTEGIPSGLMLVRCGCLRSIAAVGFVDMKEQALSQIAKSHVVTVVPRAQLTGHPVITLPGYLQALRSHHRQVAGLSDQHNPWAEDWRATFSLTEDPESVDPTAQMHDSVVLRGGRVESGAVVVRSIVCPGAVVQRGQAALETILASRTVGRKRNGRS